MPVVVDELCGRLTDDLARLAAEHEVPGASVALLIGDDVVEATCGVTNTRTGEPVTPDTLFMIQSITKVITATLVLQLVDDELVGLDDLVSDHLPGFRTADPEAGARITVRHLLTHTGGFEGDLWAATTSGDDALRRFVEDLVSRALQHSAPGERFSYCNAGFGVLGRLVEVQRGLTFEQALRRFVTGPLRVDEVAFSADQALAFRTATGHVRPEPGAALRPLFHWAVMPPSNPAAGNQLAMSARALLEFARMHLAEGRAADGRAVLSPESVHRMRERQIGHPAVHGAQSSHGLGWWLERGELVEHAGGNIGVVSMLRLAPRHRVAAVVLTNGEGGGALINDLLEPLFADLPGVTPSEPVSANDHARARDPRPYLGQFDSRVAQNTIERDDEGRLWRVTRPQRESLEMFRRAGTTVGTQVERRELRLLGDDRFVILDDNQAPAGQLEFLERDDDGRARYLYAAARAAPRVD